MFYPNRVMWPVLYCLTIASTGIIGCAKSTISDESPAEAIVDSGSDAERILRQGQKLHEIPDGVVIRISGCMGDPNESAPVGTKELIELWEFTRGQVHRVEHRSKDGKPVYQRLESRKLDSSTLCTMLLEGRAIDIHARQGTGPEMVLAGSIYRIGSRSVVVESNGQTILSLDETNGPVFHAYRQTDAEKFSQLYEGLAKHARAVFKD